MPAPADEPGGSYLLENGVGPGVIFRMARRAILADIAVTRTARK
jgi:hypothetical protein